VASDRRRRSVRSAAGGPASGGENSALAPFTERCCDVDDAGAGEGFRTPPLVAAAARHGARGRRLTGGRVLAQPARAAVPPVRRGLGMCAVSDAGAQARHGGKRDRRRRCACVRRRADMSRTEAMKHTSDVIARDSARLPAAPRTARATASRAG
jgi:hypothetical protein